MTLRTLRDPVANALVCVVGVASVIGALSSGRSLLAVFAAFATGVVATYFHVHNANYWWRYEEDAE